ncbi:MAG: sensor histidine kinase [Chloroflexi bacterium]|nr:sensor histidine kinase [Chloroflexota bacterium]
MSRSIEPGLVRAFRYFAFITSCYYAILVMFTLAQTGQGLASVQVQWYLNLGTNLVLFAYLSLPALPRWLGKFYLPVAFGLSAGAPMITNLALAAPQAGNLPWDVAPTWLTFPNLLVTVVLIAWQYSFSAVLVFSVLSAVLEVGTVYPAVGVINTVTLPLLGLPLLRAFAFGLVGHIVSTMVNTQRRQRRELIRANVRLSQHAATLEQLTLSRERNRLARELHDTMAHTLSGQAVNLEAIKLSLEPGQTEVAAMLDRALHTTREGLTEVRRAIRDLRSQPLEDLGLALAIRQLALEASARADILMHLEIADPLPRLEPEVEHTLYRIVQEALANVAQHANAGQVTLRLEVEKGVLELTIEDDGEGIDLGRVDFEGSHGLVGMQERAMMVNGRLEVSARPERGTRIHFKLDGMHDSRIDLR